MSFVNFSMGSISSSISSSALKSLGIAKSSTAIFAEKFYKNQMPLGKKNPEFLYITERF